MRIAMDAARHGFDDKAFDIAVSTQFYNRKAEGIIRKAGAFEVTQHLRGKPILPF